MKTRKLRLLSFVLAVAMMFAVMPVSAFAADAVAEVGGLKIVEGGYPMVPEEPTEDTDADQTSAIIDGINVTRKYGTTIASGKLDYCYGSGWLCKIVRGQVKAVAMEIYAGYSYAGSEIPITVDFANKGTVTGGSYNSFSNQGTVTGGYAKTLTNLSGGIIDGGTFKKLKSNAGTINAAVFEQKDNLTLPNKITATGCLINNLISTTAYTIGEPMVTISYPDSRQKVEKWFINGQEVNKTTFPDANFSHDGSYTTLTFKMPADEDVVITVEKIKTELKIKDSLPVDEKGQYSGSPSDGWTYNNGVETTEPNKSMKIEDWYTADLEKNTVRWSVTNNGILKNGTIRGGVINNGTVENVTCTGDFTNSGEIISGVFSRYAKFGAQNPSVRWVTVNGGTVNGMTTAGVVGEQEVEVKANTSVDNSFEGWTYSGDVSDAVAKQIEEQKNNETMTLTLNGDDGGTMVLTAKYNKDSFGLTMLDGKATVNGTAVSAAVPGQTVTLSIDDSEIPAGMSFDHWVVNPADVQLEGGFDAASRTTSFTMPAEELTIYASLRTDSGDDGTDAMTVVAGVAVGAGVAALTYHIGTELYAEQVLGKGVAIPRTREEVALKAWELAGKPAVELNGEPLSEAAQAEKWAVESGLMQNVDGSFNGSKKMSKLKALRTLDAAKKLG